MSSSTTRVRALAARVTFAGALLAFASGGTCTVSYSVCTTHGKGGGCDHDPGGDGGWGDPSGGGAEFAAARNALPPRVPARARQVRDAGSRPLQQRASPEPATARRVTARAAGPWAYWIARAGTALCEHPGLAGFSPRWIPARVDSSFDGVAVGCVSIVGEPGQLVLWFDREARLRDVAHDLGAPGLSGPSLR